VRDTKRTRAPAAPTRLRSYTTVKAEWEAIIVAWARGKVLPPMPAVEVVFIWSEADTKRDPDGVASGGAKLLLDGLTKAGIFEGDRWRDIKSIRHEFRWGDPKPGVHVSLQWFEAMGRGQMLHDLGFFPHRLPDLNELLALRESSARRSERRGLRGRLV
jgi:hypothetical protein